VTLESNSSMARRPYVRALVATVPLRGLAGASGFGKTITIGDAAPAASPSPASPPAASPPAADGAAPSGNGALKPVNGSAADNGLNGNGGTWFAVAPDGTKSAPQ
jgi:hypothetical protein